jgi:hypothetical protein
MDPAFSNFPRQAMFVPTIYNIALISRPPLQLYNTAGQNEPIRINHSAPQGENTFRIKADKGDFEFIPEHHQFGATTNIFVNGQVTQAGNYQLLTEKDTISGLSFNYSRDESDPVCMTDTEIESMLEKLRLTNFSILKSDHKPVNETLHEMNFGTQLWKYFIWLTLAFLLAEVVLLRRWKY